MDKHGYSFKDKVKDPCYWGDNAHNLNKVANLLEIYPSVIGSLSGLLSDQNDIASVDFDEESDSLYCIRVSLMVRAFAVENMLKAIFLLLVGSEKIDVIVGKNGDMRINNFFFEKSKGHDLCYLSKEINKLSEIKIDLEKLGTPLRQLMLFMELGRYVSPITYYPNTLNEKSSVQVRYRDVFYELERTYFKVRKIPYPFELGS